MNKQTLLVILLASIFTLSWGQNKHTISGTILDAASGETLPGATVRVIETGNFAVSNLYGFYSVGVPEGSVTVEYNFIGYQKVTKSLEISDNVKVNVELGEAVKKLKEVTITMEKLDKNVTEIEMSTTELQIEEIKKMPAFLGEVDIIKSIQLLPGVSTVGEGATGFNVRGGTIDQNLILLDEATVYSSSHLFGFFSVFNADVIKDVKLYKGGIPSRYGGRLSSVLDVRQKEGNKKRFAGAGGIGLVSSRFALEGPIKKDVGSFIIAGRRSYADIFLKFAPDTSIRNTTAYFYDLNTKVNYRLGDDDRVFLSAYFGRDVFGFGDAFGFDWGNYTGTLRWNHVFSDKLFGNFTGIYSQYDYAFGGEAFFQWSSSIQNGTLKGDFDYYLNDKHKIEFGINSIYYYFRPATFEPKGDFVDIFQEISLQAEYALEPAIYVSDEFKVNDKLTLLYGLRFSSFMNMGQRNRFEYQEGVAMSDATLIDTVSYGSGEIIKNYMGLEPRLSAKYQVDSVSSIKLSYNRMRQYLHLISNTTSGLPTDIWKPADYHIKPQIADQVAAGYFRNFMENSLEGSFEVYYKSMQNVLDYKDGAELFLNENIEAELLQGIGRAYGAELMVRKKTGDFTGWFSYTLSKSERKVDGDTPEERINLGNWYHSNYDKRNDLTIVGAYDLSKALNVGVNFTYSTGRPITYPDGKYEFNGLIVPNYSLRNQERIPAYHRLDLSATYIPKKSKKRREEAASEAESENSLNSISVLIEDPELKEAKRKQRIFENWESSWTLSIYNVYMRRNAYSIVFRQSAEQPSQTEIARTSILGTILPSITYNFSF